jgi:thiopeptide-type bacteriocin biosynthesis protein
MNEILADHLPQLLRSLGDEPDYWFIRYRSAHEPDHLRLRIQTSNDDRLSTYVSAVGKWAQQLRDDRVARRLVFDTYYPEVGRYGEGSALRAAENVFVADSRVVAVQLRHLPAGLIHPCAVAALNMVATVQGFLSGLDIATDWLTKRPAPRATPERAVTEELVELVRQGLLGDLLKGDGEVADSWQVRAEALAGYRGHLSAVSDASADASADAVLEALLHMHHNRALDVDRDSEAICRRLARQATLAWTAQHGGGQQHGWDRS